MSPLRERVEAPHRLAAPIHPDIAVWRPLVPDDATALAGLHSVADAIDHPEWTVPEAELRDRLRRESIDLASDSMAAVTDSGAIVAYGLNVMGPNPETFVRVVLEGAIHPDVRGRGIGRQLLQWQRGRAQQQLAASDLGLPGWILIWQSTDNVTGVKLAELLGFRPARYSATLARDLATPIAKRETDAAVRLVPWDSALSLAALDAHRSAFRDHWGSQPASEEMWNEMVTDEFYRADLSFLALPADDATTVAGYALTSVFAHDFERQGYSSSYVNLVGTRREWRGHGVAAALLANVLTASQQAGLEKVVLDVDVENPTGAVGLYESLGFQATGGRQVALVLSY
ncbi:GNAT family N-acetyltransferase [Gryllotalpicola protaetiae]|uniref:GNAT family N-acetyltransferase n=1 Tax=Gryllotalpicola protaetiae TaxID=2419771 RepID=A0A387BFZ8_9MICO|nr:GNAT family N-acetyltransferase [Gryllotalpicola protaetiae]